MGEFLINMCTILITVVFAGAITLVMIWLLTTALNFVFVEIGLKEISMSRKFILLFCAMVMK
ncbi:MULTISPECIES: hypothetical protein [unclassified Clostridium]|uniref:hypothetical protein n=1 Tax=unclassified Clostridium TaxID=2614128 RepID=UPI0025BF1FFE|nr:MULTISPECIES: hypothetical protein [unclassified Clostridium]